MTLESHTIPLGVVAGTWRFFSFPPTFLKIAACNPRGLCSAALSTWSRSKKVECAEERCPNLIRFNYGWSRSQFLVLNLKGKKRKMNEIPQNFRQKKLKFSWVLISGNIWRETENLKLPIICFYEIIRCMSPPIYGFNVSKCTNRRRRVTRIFDLCSNLFCHWHNICMSKDQDLNEVTPDCSLVEKQSNNKVSCLETPHVGPCRSLNELLIRRRAH